MASLETPSDSLSSDPDECAPEAAVPAWFSGFLFHVLNPRQVSMYLYLMMLCDEVGSCHPTIDQIRADLGLLSATMVFESISVLEEYGFFVRNRQSFPEARSKRNAYQRTTCEYPVLRLLQIGRIDGNLHASESPVAPASDEAKRLTEEGLHKLLEGEYHRYSLASNDQKKDILIEVLSQTLAERSRGIYL